MLPLSASAMTSAPAAKASWATKEKVSGQGGQHGDQVHFGRAQGLHHGEAVAGPHLDVHLLQPGHRHTIGGDCEVQEPVGGVSGLALQQALEGRPALGRNGEAGETYARWSWGRRGDGLARLQ